MSKESLITSVRQRLNNIARESQVDFNADNFYSELLLLQQLSVNTG